MPTACALLDCAGSTLAGAEDRRCPESIKQLSLHLYTVSTAYLCVSSLVRAVLSSVPSLASAAGPESVNSCVRLLTKLCTATALCMPSAMPRRSALPETECSLVVAARCPLGLYSGRIKPG